MASKPTIIGRGITLDPAERERRRELIKYCEASRSLRRTNALKWQDWYEQGRDAGQGSIYNKLLSHIDLVSAFLFSPGTVRFGVHLPPQVRATWMEAATIARDEFRETWECAGMDLVLQMALDWSLVFGTEVLKVQSDPTTGFRLSMIPPWDFGASREDLVDLDAQDSFCHWYTLSIPQLRWWLHDHPEEASLLALAEAHAQSDRTGSSRQRLVLASITGTFPTGSIAGGFPGSPTVDVGETSLVEQPTVELVDLWEKRLFKRKGPTGEPEYFEDYLVSTWIADADILLLQRRNPDLPETKVSLRTSLPAEHPFELLRPRPRPRLLWGRSELTSLTPLQSWLDEYVGDVRDIVRKQVLPPTFFSGVPDFEEAGEAMESAGGRYGSAEPNAKMEKLVPPLTPETLSVFKMILGMFEDSSGVPGSIAEPAQMPGGVRSTGHFSMAAGIGAGRIRRMALTVENTLGSVATKAFHLLQRTSTDAFKTKEGQTFLLSQLPSAISLTVNGHSAAPIFAEQTQAKAFALQKAGALTLEDLVELVDPPNREELKIKAQKLAEGRAKMQEELMQIQAEKAQHGGGKVSMPKKGT